MASTALPANCMGSGVVLLVSSITESSLLFTDVGGVCARRCLAMGAYLAPHRNAPRYRCQEIIAARHWAHDIDAAAARRSGLEADHGRRHTRAAVLESGGADA